MGSCYEKGKGVAENKGEALRLYHLSAEQKNIEGLFQLGDYYNRQLKDDVQSFHYFKLAADQGHVQAKRIVAFRYEKGLGVEANQNKAFLLYQDAANKGDKIAQFEFGLLYERGSGERNPDIEKAISWYKLSAQQGYTKAIDKISYFTRKGYIVDNHEVKATPSSRSHSSDAPPTYTCRQFKPTSSNEKGVVIPNQPIRRAGP